MNRRPDLRTSTRRSSGRREGRSSKNTGSKNTGSKNTGSKVPGPSALSVAGTKFTTRAVILLAVLLLLIASYTTTVHSWWQQRSEIAALEREKVQVQDDIDALEDLRSRWADPAFVKAQARARFGWVMPGEVGYRVIGSDGSLRGESAQLSDVPAADAVGWHTKLLGTFERAGRSADDPLPDDETPPDPDTVIRDAE